MQVGAPTDRAQYIHRLGRTARAGKQGRGILLLCTFERSFLKEVADLLYYIYTYMYVHIHTCVYTYIHTDVYICVCVCVCACVCVSV